METSNTLDRMATYDFKTPIDIVYFEENSDDEIDLTSSPKSKDEENNKVVDDTDLNSTETETIQSKQLEDKKKVNSKKRKSATEIREIDKHKENTQDRSPIIVSPKKKKTSEIENTINEASDSLKTISKYLTLILESHHHYLLAANNKNSTPDQISLSKKSYWTVKQHFFKAAYEHVNRHVLPNENNQAFIHNFLNFTISMANNRIKIDCNRGITEIYFELINSVKQRKHKDFKEKCKTPILAQHLSATPVIPDITISESIKNGLQHPNQANQDKLCIFSSGPPGRHIDINVDKSLINYNNQVPGNNQLPQNKVIQQNLNTQQNSLNIISPNGDCLAGRVNNLENNYGNRQMYEELMRRQNNLVQPVIPANGYHPIADNRVPHYAPPPNHLRNVNESNQISPNTNYNYYHTTNNFQNKTYHSANNFIQNGTSQVPNTIVQEDRNFQIFKRGHPPRTDVLVRAPPPPYPTPVAVHPNQMMQPATPAHTILPGPPSGPDLTRSCLSTDSGFVSPVGSKSSTNPVEDIMNDLFELENTYEPPRAAPSQSICHVCHKHATLMCSACYKTAYCNMKCQRIDWQAHRLFCPPQTRKRGQ